MARDSHDVRRGAPGTGRPRQDSNLRSRLRRGSRGPDGQRRQLTFAQVRRLFPPEAVTITDDENGLLADVVLPICCPSRRRAAATSRSCVSLAVEERLPSRSARATIVYMTVEPLREVRNHFSDVIDRVEREHERVTVTRNGRAAAVIISLEDLAELEETLAVLSDPEALADIREADAAYRAGDVVRGVDAVRALRS
ncbi:MAG TPA: type II toxin-antitoxin system Phd/YefM family antitoxin [Nocardioides sp.]|uniref:type II toxin-antitoxin system Phd/YefM family antitoxin n=1 Tax=Nocardioides sp. TaxID=35761 RepID=UPI002F3E223B